MTVGYNVLSYDLGDEYSYLDGVGRSRVASLGFDYTIDRGRRHNLYTGIRYEHSQIKDEYRSFGATYGDKTGNAMVFSLYGDDQDTAGTTNWRVDYKWGHITNKSLYSANPYDQWLADSPRTAGTYEKLRGYIERHQNINERLYLLLTAQGQYAFSNLDSSEHFSLGGPYGVKAYPTSEASGDTGYLTRAELRWLLPLKKHDQQLQLATYLEHGGIWINKDSSAWTTHGPWALKNLSATAAIPTATSGSARASISRNLIVFLTYERNEAYIYEILQQKTMDTKTDGHGILGHGFRRHGCPGYALWCRYPFRSGGYQPGWKKYDSSAEQPAHGY